MKLVQVRDKVHRKMYLLADQPYLLRNITIYKKLYLPFYQNKHRNNYYVTYNNVQNRYYRSYYDNGFEPHILELLYLEIYNNIG